MTRTFVGKRVGKTVSLLEKLGPNPRLYLTDDLLHHGMWGCIWGDGFHEITPPKINMEPQSEGLEDDVPFQRAVFQVPC